MPLLKFFSVPIFCGILLGVLFPYKSMSLIGLSSFLLFALLFVNTLVVDAQEIFRALRKYWRQIAATQLLLFVFFPVLLTALSTLGVRDGDFIFGLAMSTLAPCALVNPFFARVRRAVPALALANVLISTLLTPFLTVPILKLVQEGHIFIDPQALFLYLCAISFTPVLLSLACSQVAPAWGRKVLPALPGLNSCLLAALMFILVGSSMNRLPSRTLFSGDFFWLFGFYAAMDFGLFILVRHVARIFLPRPEAESMALSIATRNFALSASLLLFFHPKAALPSAIGLIVHCLFFQWLMSKKSDNLPE